MCSHYCQSLSASVLRSTPSMVWAKLSIATVTGQTIIRIQGTSPDILSALDSLIGCLTLDIPLIQSVTGQPNMEEEEEEEEDGGA